MGDDLTKFPLPLIIISGCFHNRPLGVGATPSPPKATVGRLSMKVSVYKDDEGGMAVLVEASPGKGKAPFLIKGITLENITEQVLPVIEEMRGPKVPRSVLV